MAMIVPRWEWRTFGAHFGITERRFAESTPGAVQESDELYLSRRVRCERESARRPPGHQGPPGGERRRPGALGADHEAAVPVAGCRRGKGVRVAGSSRASVARDAYSLDQFIGEVVAPSGVLHPVRVHKRRVRYTVGGCISELSDVRAEGRATRTIAIEAEDAAAVVSAVASVGLSGYFNTNYALGLGALLDDAPERYAVIDVGTNSVKLHVGERDGTASWRTIVDRAELTRLGEGLEKNEEITPEAASGPRARSRT